MVYVPVASSWCSTRSLDVLTTVTAPGALSTMFVLTAPLVVTAAISTICPMLPVKVQLSWKLGPEIVPELVVPETIGPPADEGTAWSVRRSPRTADAERRDRTWNPLWLRVTAPAVGAPLLGQAIPGPVTASAIGQTPVDREIARGGRGDLAGGVGRLEHGGHRAEGAAEPQWLAWNCGPQIRGTRSLGTKNQEDQATILSTPSVAHVAPDVRRVDRCTHSVAIEGLCILPGTVDGDAAASVFESHTTIGHPVIDQSVAVSICGCADHDCGVGRTDGPREENDR